MSCQSSRHSNANKCQVSDVSDKTTANNSRQPLATIAKQGSGKGKRKASEVPDVATATEAARAVMAPDGEQKTLLEIGRSPDEASGGILDQLTGDALPDNAEDMA